ncbi:sensor histidine kinase [Streptoalloteichus hindustanus]|uniref:histidine kinase n=1 Tax=Streptoalloteichus hindustanus TaxID=2017 RepID=A0A1M5LE41_STRHI|nr:histidine kinase [Streptoalloteichus hindustanus]SHG63384.1 Signal transduction histidine kinase [Streptoalloteichus hindustanus]
MSAASPRVSDLARKTGVEVLLVGVSVSLALMFRPSPFPWAQNASLVACLLLPLRLLSPALMMVVCLPAVFGGLGLVPAVLALFRVGRRTRSITLVTTWVVLVAAVGLLGVLWSQPWLLWTDLALSAVFGVLYAGAPALLGKLVTTREELARSLREQQRARAAELAAREEHARAEERAAIAREIHDAVGHHATLIAVESAALAATTQDGEARESALRLRALAKESLGEMRAALGLLNDAPVPVPGLPQLPEIVAKARSAGLTVRLEDRSALGAELTPSAGRAVYRVVQEAMTNAAKHAPGAPVVIRLDRRSGRLRLTVENGVPTGAPLPEEGAHGAGLPGLAERVRMAGGELTAAPTATGGFAVVAEIPLRGVDPVPTKVDDNDSTIGGSPFGLTPA